MTDDATPALGRRDFLVLGSTCAVSAALTGSAAVPVSEAAVPAAAPPIGNSGPRRTIETFTAETFLPYRGQRLTFLRPPDATGRSGAPVELELIEVTAHGRAMAIEQARGARIPRQRQPFSLLFALRRGEPLAPGLVRLTHAGFEPCDLLLTRVMAPAGAAHYEAVFG